jgi:hypothetical protein
LEEDARLRYHAKMAAFAETLNSLEEQRRAQAMMRKKQHLENEEARQLALRDRELLEEDRRITIIQELEATNQKVRIVLVLLPSFLK